MHYNTKAQRWCYDEKYGLTTDHGERYFLDGKTNRVLTGIIEHSAGVDFANGNKNIEINFRMVI